MVKLGDLVHYKAHTGLTKYYSLGLVTKIICKNPLSFKVEVQILFVQPKQSYKRGSFVNIYVPPWEKVEKFKYNEGKTDEN